jgi:hypothetical protein
MSCGRRTYRRSATPLQPAALQWAAEIVKSPDTARLPVCRPDAVPAAPYARVALLPGPVDTRDWPRVVEVVTSGLSPPVAAIALLPPCSMPLR